jgi:SHS2 domain-containing protein
MPYRYLEDVAIADVAFEATGDDLVNVFVAAADATMNVMIGDISSISPRESRSFKLENDDLEMLLLNLLQELIYYKDAEQLLLRITDLRIAKHGRRYVLRATASGERLDVERHEQRADVKAVTLHRFSLHRTADGWKAEVILDV